MENPSKEYDIQHTWNIYAHTLTFFKSHKQPLICDTYLCEW